MGVISSALAYEGFSLSHAAILDGVHPAYSLVQDGEYESLYGIKEGTVVPDEGQYDNEGDDRVLSTWFWVTHATLTVKSGYVPFNTVAAIAGSTITSTGVGNAAVVSIPIWNLSAENQSRKPVLLRMPSKDAAGNVRNLDIVLFNLQFSPFKFEGPAYKAGLMLDYGGRALFSNNDETGTALPEPTIGKLISHP